MESYYKEGGFFDRLEKLSHRIDWFTGGIYWDYIEYGILYFIPGLRSIARIRGDISHFNNAITIHKHEIKQLTEEYNREKYFWMAEK